MFEVEPAHRRLSAEVGAGVHADMMTAKQNGMYTRLSGFAITFW